MTMDSRKLGAGGLIVFVGVNVALAEHAEALHDEPHTHQEAYTHFQAPRAEYEQSSTASASMILQGKTLAIRPDIDCGGASQSGPFRFALSFGELQVIPRPDDLQGRV
jgi:hypothetical protein